MNLEIGKEAPKSPLQFPWQSSKTIGKAGGLKEEDAMRKKHGAKKVERWTPIKETAEDRAHSLQLSPHWMNTRGNGPRPGSFRGKIRGVKRVLKWSEKTTWLLL